MSRNTIVALLAAAALFACKGEPTRAAETPSPAPPQTEEEKTLYAVGLILGDNLKQLDLTAAEVELVKRGFTDAAAQKPPLVALETYGPKVQELARARAQKRADAQKQKSQAFADTASKEEGSVRLSSGLVYKTLAPGSGANPAAGDTVKVHYRGTLTDGTEFDSSIKRGEPVEFKLNQVIPCWTEGVQKMKVGEKARLVCPSGIAYGDQGRPPVIPGGATLVFEVELLGINKK